MLSCSQVGAVLDGVRLSVPEVGQDQVITLDGKIGHEVIRGVRDLVLLVLSVASLYYYATSFYASFCDALQKRARSLKCDLQGTSESFGWAGNLLRNAEVEGSIPFRSTVMLR
jgi:hypothetical protein